MSLFNVNFNELRPSNTTTIIGVMYDDGIILGSTDAITQLNVNVLLCHCAHETEIILEDTRNFIIDQENIKVTTEIIGTMLSAFKPVMNNMLQTSVIIGGGKKLFEISEVGIVMEKLNFAVGGYGVAYLNNLLDKKWKKGMNEEQAEKLVLKILSLDISLGGVRSCGIQTASINSKGVTRAFHPHNTLPNRGRDLVKYVPARSVYLHQRQ
ncbi:proteasome subunit beta type-6-like [Solanum verrucosum]|uniref:proteasome subunit beta type-6-like n=1 Tax=Solanum verrucosum TaxID=315347 RepID=UPI0020D0F581|nr:proteasome subunit beta type-6-like [Solanum verrucosum]